MLDRVKIFDAHFHIIDYRFPVIPNEGYMPDAFTVDDYLDFFRNRDLIGGVVVAGSFHGSDYSHIKYALDILGDGFFGVINPDNRIYREIDELDNFGIRGVRYNVKRMGREILRDIESLSVFIYESKKWHIDLYIENRDLKEYKSLILSLPKVIIDHFGVTYEGFEDLLQLVSYGVKVKASGFGRLDFDWMWALRELVNVDPSSVVFGSDLPGTRVERKFDWSDVESIMLSFDREIVDRILWRNAFDFYINPNL